MELDPIPPNGQNGSASLLGLQPGTPPPTKHVPEEPAHVVALKAAIKAHLEAILAKPLSTKMLTELESVAHMSRDLLITTKDPKGLRRRGPRSMGQYYPGNIGYDVDVDVGEEEMADAVAPVMSNGIVGGMGGPLRAETFAHTLIRELVAMSERWRQPQKVETASDLVFSLSQAKTAQMSPDIIDGLEKRLRDVLAGTTVDEATVPPKLSGEGATPHEHG